jgi:hypothetical protein
MRRRGRRRGSRRSGCNRCRQHGGGRRSARRSKPDGRRNRCLVRPAARPSGRLVGTAGRGSGAFRSNRASARSEVHASQASLAPGRATLGIRTPTATTAATPTATAGTRGSSICWTEPRPVRPSLSFGRTCGAALPHTATSPRASRSLDCARATACRISRLRWSTARHFTFDGCSRSWVASLGWLRNGCDSLAVGPATHVG